MAIKKRTELGRPLTHEEVDANFQHLIDMLEALPEPSPVVQGKIDGSGIGALLEIEMINSANKVVFTFEGSSFEIPFVK